MDERILARPVRKAHDTRRTYLDKLKAHQAELKKLTGHWEAVGWNSDRQRSEYYQYAKDLKGDVNTLEGELLRAGAKGGGPK